MGSRQAAIGASVALILSGVPGARSAVWGAPPGFRPSPTTGLRTDRLSAAQLRRWKAIVAIVRAEDRHHRPLHPTLRGLFDAVNGGPHTVFIEMPDTKSYIAGRFEVTSVDADGRAHQGILILNLRAIDKASTGPAAARADGFVPFRGLTRSARYAEVLGHELAHAAWHLASTERARLAHRLQGRLEEQARVLLKDSLAGRGADARAGETDLDRLARELEQQAETAERAVWEELQAAKGGRNLFARGEERAFPD
jgi:hypothetical protein